MFTAQYELGLYKQSILRFEFKRLICCLLMALGYQRRHWYGVRFEWCLVGEIKCSVEPAAVPVHSPRMPHNVTPWIEPRSGMEAFNHLNCTFLVLWKSPLDCHSLPHSLLLPALKSPQLMSVFYCEIQSYAPI